jgi:hypothetical protein
MPRFGQLARIAHFAEYTTRTRARALCAIAHWECAVGECAGARAAGTVLNRAQTSRRFSGHDTDAQVAKTIAFVRDRLPNETDPSQYRCSLSSAQLVFRRSRSNVAGWPREFTASAVARGRDARCLCRVDQPTTGSGVNDRERKKLFERIEVAIAMQ